MADLQVTISATGAAELSTLFSSLEKVSTAAGKLAGSGKALEELRKLMVGLGNSGSSLGGLNKALNNVVSELQALPTRMATVLQNVPAQMARTGRAAGEALGQGIEQGAAASVGQARQRIRSEVDQVQRDVEAAIRQQVLAATRAAGGSFSTLSARPTVASPVDVGQQASSAQALVRAFAQHDAERKATYARAEAQQKATDLAHVERMRATVAATWAAASIVREQEANLAAQQGRSDSAMAAAFARHDAERKATYARAEAQQKATDLAHVERMRATVAATWATVAQIREQEAAKFETLAQQASRRVSSAMTSPVRGPYSDLRSGRLVQPPAAASEIDPKRADSGTNALLRQKAAIDAYIPTANTGHSAARGLASGFGLLWLTWGNMLPLLTTAAASNGFVAMAKSGAEVQHTLTMISALSGVSASEIAGLNEQMHDLAKNGIFGPRDIAEALKVLTQAGLSAKEASANLGATLNFSVAGMVPIQQAAETLVTVTTAFNMGAAGFSVAGDVIAKTAAISKTSVEGMSGAFKTASVLNAQYGVTLTDVGVGLAALANLGIEASAAGTALRNMYADLSGRSSKVSQILKEQGIQLRELATGKFPDVIKMVRELNDVLSKKTPMGAQNLIQALVGERGGKPLVEMLELFRKAPKDLSAGFSNALEEMQSEIKNAYGTSVMVAIAANTSVKNQYASLIASFQSDMVRVFEENEPRLLSAIASIKKSLLDGGELRAVLSGLLGLMSRIVQVLAENAKVFSALLGIWAASRVALALLSVANTQLAGSAGAAAVGLTAQAGAATAAGTAAAGAVGPLAGLASMLSKLNFWLGLAATAWTLYQLAKNGSAEAKASAGQFSFDETMSALRKENEKLEGELVLLRQGKSLTEAKAAADASDLYQKAAEGMAQKRLGLEAQLARFLKSAGANSEGVPAPGTSPALLGMIAGAKKQVEEAKKAEASALQSLKDQQARLLANSQAKAELIEQGSKRTPIGTPGGDEFSGHAPKAPKAEHFANYTNDLLKIQKDGHSKRMAELQQESTFEKQILDAKHRALLTSDADYQAESLAQTIADEQRRLTEVSNFRSGSRAEIDQKMASVVRDAGGVDLAEKSKLEGEAYSKLTPHIQNLVGQYKKLVEARELLDAQTGSDEAKIKAETEQRRRMNEIDLAGRIRAEGKAYTDTARDLGVHLESQQKSLQAEERAADMSTIVLAGQKARLAFEDEFAPKIAKRVEALQQWEEAEASLGRQLDLALQTNEVDSVVITQLSLNYYAVKNAVAQFRAELERLRGVQAEGAGTAQIRAEIAEARKETSKLQDDIAEGLANAIKKGSGGFKEHWTSLRDWLKDLFAKTVLKPVIKQVLSSGASSLSGLMFGGSGESVGAGGALGGLNSLASLSGLAGSLGSFGSYAATGFMNTIAGTGMMSGIGAGSSLVAGGSAAAGAGMTVGAAMPYVLAALAVANALSTKATPHVGGYALSDASGNVSDITKQQGGNQHAETQTAVSTLSRNLALSFNSVATTFGKDAGTSIRAVFEADGKDASWGLFHILDQAGQKLQGSFDALGTLPSNATDGLKEFSAKAATAVRDALVAMDIPDWARQTLNDLGTAVDVDALTTAAQKIADVQKAFKNFLETLKPYGPAFASVAAMSVNALDKLATVSGGLDQLSTSLTTYYDKFFTAEEKRANTIAYLTAELGKVGLHPTSMAAYRSEVDKAQGQLDTPEGQAKFSALIRLSGAFASLFEDTVSSLTKAISGLYATRGDLQVELYKLQGNPAAAAELQRLTDLTKLTEGLTEAERDAVVAAYDYNESLKSQISALQHAAEVNRSVTDLEDTGRSLRVSLLKSQGRTEEAAALQRTLDLAKLTQGMTADEAARVTTAYDANAALQLQIDAQEAANRAAEEAAAAAKQLKEAWQSVTDSIFEEVRRIRGLTDNPANDLASRQAEFAVLTAQARAGDQDAAKKLVAASSGLMDAIKNSAASAFDYRLQAASTAGSLETTGNKLAKQFGLKVPKYDVGTNYVPFDQLAMLHEGEAVTPKEYNPAAGAARGDDTNAAAEEVRQLRDEQRRQTIAMAALQTRLLRLMERWEADGMPETRVTTP